MSWEHTRESWNRLATSLAEADEDVRYAFFFWVLGLSMMGIAIVAQFGWVGLLFCLGAIIWHANNVK